MRERVVPAGTEITRSGVLSGTWQGLFDHPEQATGDHLWISFRAKRNHLHMPILGSNLFVGAQGAVVLVAKAQNSQGNVDDSSHLLNGVSELIGIFRFAI